MSNLSRHLTSSILDYLYGQFQYLDPVEDPIASFKRSNVSITQIEPQSSDSLGRFTGKSRFNLYFLPHLFFYAVSTAWGFVGLHYYQTGSIDLRTLLKSPYIVNHQMFLPDMWPQIDLCWYGAIGASFAAYVCLVFQPVHEGRYKMVLKHNGRLAIRKIELSKEDSLKILVFRGRYKTTFFAIIVALILLAMLYYYAIVWYQDLYRVNILDVIFWLVLFPRLIFDIVFGIFGIMVFVIMASKYMQIQLKSILNKIAKLNRQISTQNYSFPSVWRSFTEQNRRLLSLCLDIEEYTHFWSPYLSIMFPFYMWIQAYLSYILFFIDSVPFVQKYLFFCAVVEFDLVLFLLIDQCARMVKLNSRILSENRRFFINIQESRVHKRQMKIRKLLLAESLQNSKRLHNFAFRLFGNYRITSKTFHLVISCMSTFFLLVIKSQRIKTKSLSLF